ncbi:hypothetical protein AGLY_004257 [Aphis glycines]|uniref:Uncharacterized protein n=1 Tax=Aphis glycines TaxID=307491 RepID=A0A6G0TXK2_APHGL|nr:hypothetical protein AGLY_004257 [Aphis glycines]
MFPHYILNSRTNRFIFVYFKIKKQKVKLTTNRTQHRHNIDQNNISKIKLLKKDSEVNANPVLEDIVKVFSPAYKSYYRAKILSAEEMAELCNIFELSDNLKKQPGNAIRIGIDISLDKTPNEEIINMFDHLATHEIQLSMEYNESDEKGLDNCVLKVISNGLNINNESQVEESMKSPSILTNGTIKYKLICNGYWIRQQNKLCETGLWIS